MNVHLDPPGAATAADLPEIADLLRATFPTDRAWSEELPWQYLHNPCGPALYVNARTEEGRLVGHYAVLPLPPLADERFSAFKVLLSLNTAVHPDAQGKGLFKATARKLYEYLEQQQSSVVLGVANAASTPGFVGSLGFYSLGRLSLRFYPPWTKAFEGPDRTLAADPAFAAWRAQRPGGRFAKDETTRSLHRVIVHKGATVHGVLTHSMPSEHWQALGHVPARSSLSRLKDPLLYACSGPPPVGGVPVPERFRPSPLSYICRVLPDKNAASLINYLTSHRFEFLDFDVL